MNGGQVQAIRQREVALARYYEKPNVCLQCGGIIEVGDQKVSVVRKKKFCDRSCAATYNNGQIPKRKRTVSLCACGQEKQKVSVVCSSCCSKMGAYTKEYLLSRGSSYYHRSLRDNARSFYLHSGKPLVCATCCYDKSVEICHIKAIKDFPLTATVKEINDISNLMALCPTHHWEYDHGV